MRIKRTIIVLVTAASALAGTAAALAPAAAPAAAVASARHAAPDMLYHG